MAEGKKKSLNLILHRSLKKDSAYYNQLALNQMGTTRGDAMICSSLDYLVQSVTGPSQTSGRKERASVTETLIELSHWEAGEVGVCIFVQDTCPESLIEIRYLYHLYCQQKV